MKVMVLAEGRKYDVWGMCTDDERCQVLELLPEVGEEHPDLVSTMMALLRGVVPDEGPPLYDEFRAKMLYRDVLFELKADKDLPRRKHLGLRVAFFFVNEFTGGPVVVCTNAFTKHGSSTPQEYIDYALSERSRFYQEIDELEFVS
jgi:hypothetical protein